MELRQNQAARIPLAVFWVAYYYLTKKTSGPFPIHLLREWSIKVFNWIVGKSIQEALEDEDCRELTGTSVKEEQGSIYLNSARRGEFFFPPPRSRSNARAVCGEVWWVAC